MEFVHHPIRVEQTPKDPSRNRPGTHLVKGVGEIPAAPLGVTHAALDLLAAEGDKVEATALPSLQRQHEVFSTFTPFLFALQRMKKATTFPQSRELLLRQSLCTAPTLATWIKHLAFSGCAAGHRKRAGQGCSPGPALSSFASERIVEMRGEGVGGREPWKD